MAGDGQIAAPFGCRAFGSQLRLTAMTKVKGRARNDIFARRPRKDDRRNWGVVYPMLKAV
jgi:hypothetical protein